MSGRRQAVTVAILFALVPLLYVLSGAVVALVTLRKGWQEGALVMLWALLPALLFLSTGDASAVLLLLAALVGGQALRSTGSWQATLAILTLLGLAAQWSLALQSGYVAQVTAAFEQLQAEGLGLQLPQADGTMAPAAAGEVTALLLHFYGAWHMTGFVACLALARHWQAQLYNPGGFRQEFHSLRLDRRFGGLLLALLAAGEFGLEPFASWVPLYCVAPLVSGLALCHHIVAQRRMGANWLVLVYLLGLVITPALVALGFIDSLANLRQRLAPVAPEANAPRDDDQD